MNKWLNHVKYAAQREVTGRQHCCKLTKSRHVFIRVTILLDDRRYLVTGVYFGRVWTCDEGEFVLAKQAGFMSQHVSAALQ